MAGRGRRGDIVTTSSLAGTALHWPSTCGNTAIIVTARTSSDKSWVVLGSNVSRTFSGIESASQRVDGRGREGGREGVLEFCP